MNAATVHPAGDRAAWSAAIEEHGFAVVDDVLDEAVLVRLEAALSTGSEVVATLTRGAGAYGARNLLQLAAVRELAASSALAALVEPVLGPAAQPVRALLFDKVADANWPVGWHQDLIIPVRERREAAGFGPWSVKAGVPHVKPPASVLVQMLALRIHLDDCHADNGPLRIIPGSHRHGELEREELQRLIAEAGEAVCLAARGSVLAMRPLVLHASSRAERPEHRRVIHIEYAAEPLPHGLEWPDWQAADI